MPNPPVLTVWRVATVLSVSPVSAYAHTLVLDVPGWPGHLAGHHLDVRLVADDGYQAQRSYSIASPPEDEHVAITVEYLEDGEVSPYLTKVLRPGDGLEVRGPIGGYFVWDVHVGGRLLLIAGGSGVVPLLAMLRHHARADAPTRSRIPVRLLYSARSWNDVIDRNELQRLSEQPEVDVTFTLTRDAPADWMGRRGRVDRAMLHEVSWPPSAAPRVFVCGPTGFVESVATQLVELGHDPLQVRTERFGATG